MPHTSAFQSRLILSFACLALGIAAVWYFTRPEPVPNPVGPELPRPDPPAPDPRLVFSTPYRNVKPNVDYVGDAVCAKCHLAITESYHAHPMGRSAAAVSAATPIEKYDPSGRTMFSSGVFDLFVEISTQGVKHGARVRGPTPVPVSDLNMPVEIAIGSGTRGRSYLCVGKGTVWQSPISWFETERKWDVSPGFRLGNTARRAIVPSCLYCHVDRVEPAAGTDLGADNRYRERVFPAQLAIGCERCHGPGELHVAERKSGAHVGRDTAIVNPRHLSPTLQFAICEQCHLLGEERVIRRGRSPFEYRPGLPFEQFVSVYVRDPGIAAVNRSVGQFEQLEQSKCFSGSRGGLLCTTCHDPHATPADKESHYRRKCLSCHESKGCSLPQPQRLEKNDSCIACHMPRAASSSVAHASVTDHRIPRAGRTQAASRGLPVGTSPLVRFRSGQFSPSEDERNRDLGLALAAFAKKPVPELISGRGGLNLLASERLRRSLSRWPGDGGAWLALATLDGESGKDRQKLQSARDAVALMPNSETALAALVEAASSAREFDEAIQAADKRIELNPFDVAALASRAVVFILRGKWDNAEADCRAALKLQPLHPHSHTCLGICLHKKGDREAGQRELQTALLLEPDPREQAVLRDWYQRATR